MAAFSSGRAQDPMYVNTPPHSASPINYLLPLYLDLSLQTWYHLMYIHKNCLVLQPSVA